MHKEDDRRQFVRAALLLGFIAAGATPLAALAAPGRVLFGTTLQRDELPLMDALLNEIRQAYQPDLGSKLALMPGNGGIVAMTALRNSAPDGSTTWLAPSSLVTLQPLLRPLQGLDPVNDFVPVAGVGEFTGALTVGPAVPAEVKTALDYVAWIKANPTNLSFGALGIGTMMHLAGAVMGKTIDRPLTSSAYKSSVSLLDDLASGALPAAMLPLPGAIHAVSKPGVRMLALLSDTRWPGFPELPTLLELGLAPIAAVQSLGFFLPAGTPAAKVQQLAEAVRRAARNETVVKLMEASSLRPMPASAGDYAAALARERSSWAALLKQHQFKFDA